MRLLGVVEREALVEVFSDGPCDSRIKIRDPKASGRRPRGALVFVETVFKLQILRAEPGRFAPSPSIAALGA
jgi:hypothetical protein